MTFEEALRTKTGDILYTHLGDRVVISGWHQNFENPCVKDDLYFYCVDTTLQTIKYRYDELCGPELCDEDTMFINWCSKNKIDNSYNISQLKSAFLHGFHCGHSHKIIEKTDKGENYASFYK